MPIYEFICQSCQKVTEVLLLPSDPHPTRCPECGGKLHKRLSAPAIQFKGSGWYITDYARRPSAGGNGEKPKAAADGGAAPAGEKPATSAAPKEKSSDTGESTSSKKDH